MNKNLVIGVPSKGRLSEQTCEAFAKVGLHILKIGSKRGYRGEIEGIINLEVSFISAAEIANSLITGRIHLGVIGEDLIREEIIGANDRVKFLRKLNFGHADVVVAVPDCWIDVRRMRDVESAAQTYRRHHHRRIRVATKYMNLTRQHFIHHGISDYRIVESLGATEGTPTSGKADMIVDITSTGETLKANNLRILDGNDGVILRSEANLVASNTIKWIPETREIENEILSQFDLK
ncbi:MAG: ATP phosphoribosyltransferase [Hyphomicrobiaceae bacterium]|nr:ATP phosphoribosyltransferase [Hyphomicrobiaceae bacterium]